MKYIPDTGLIDLSVRQVLDSISYSNVLPPWVETLSVDYGGRRRRISERLQALASSSSVAGAYKMQVPSGGGTRQKTWSVPSVNDQIVLHYLALSISKKLGATNEKSVYSYLKSSDDSIAFIENQVDGWRRFQAATTARGAKKYMLQIDLKSAYQSISRQRFIEFLEGQVGRTLETELLGAMIESIADGDPGLPLVNDSLFYLGNVYLSVVDDVVQRHCDDYIRFVDDYRIFFESASDVESSYSSISRSVSEIGFEINLAKTRSGTIDDYINATSRKRIDQIEGDGGYIGAVVFSNAVEPKEVVGLISTAVQNYDRYLTEGYGRLLTSLVRKMVLDTAVQKKMNYVIFSLDEFSKVLSEDRALVQKLSSLLQLFLKERDQSWRVLWLLYVMRHLDPDALPTMPRIAEAIAGDRSVAPAARLWAARFSSGAEPSADVELLHAMGYLEEGRALTGVTL